MPLRFWDGILLVLYSNWFPPIGEQCYCVLLRIPKTQKHIDIKITFLYYIETIARRMLALRDYCLTLIDNGLILRDNCLMLRDTCLTLRDNCLSLRDNCLILRDNCVYLSWRVKYCKRIMWWKWQVKAEWSQLRDELTLLPPLPRPPSAVAVGWRPSQGSHTHWETIASHWETIA